MAEKYNVSKTPVRDALGALEIEGYLVSLPRKGYLVKPVTQKNIRESFQMRLVFEKAAASIAVRTGDATELQRILEIAIKFPEAPSEDQVNEFNSLNADFHMAIVRASHNSLLIDMYVGIMENLSRILWEVSEEVELLSEKEEHLNIARALVERDGKKADELLTEHILNFERKVYVSQIDI